MKLSSRVLDRSAAETGFGREPLEKVARLLDLLNGIRAHPFLRGRVVLKGGTALNLFLFDLPRLSVDIDLNYVGAADRETMLEERPKVEQALTAVFGRADLSVRRMPTDHAGGKWRLRYTDVTGRQGNLELDVNFLSRVPLWPPKPMDSRPIGPFTAKRIPVLDVHELAAGKLAALFSRSAARDLFDVRLLLAAGNLHMDMLRVAFVVYCGCSRRDWRTIAIEDIDVLPKEAGRQLAPVLKASMAPEPGKVVSWTADMVAGCRRVAGSLLPLRSNEREFLEALNERGEVLPELLTGDENLQERIRAQPGLQWKAQNVRSHRRRR